MASRLEVIAHELMDKAFPLIMTKLDEAVKLLIEQLPLCERVLFESFELLFAPKYVIRQFILITVVEFTIMGIKLSGKIGNALVVFLSKAEREQKDVLIQLAKAKTYVEWRHMAERLDFMRGNDKWRMADKSSLYDFQVLKKRINDTIEMIQQGDVFRLMFRMRGKQRHPLSLSPHPPSPSPSISPTSPTLTLSTHPFPFPL